LPRKTNVLPGYRDNLLFILVYLKTFPLQELQAATFSMTQLQANFWIHLLSPILRKTLKRLEELPDRRIMFLSQTYAGSVHDKNIFFPISLARMARLPCEFFFHA
jgi:hypothetical protein